MELRLKTVQLSKLLLDPNNYRFLDQTDWRRRQERRFHEDTVQKSTLRTLEQTSRYKLADLRRSILANGYVPVERIVVIPYQHVEGKYLIVEGNRRIAALKALLRDHDDGSITLTSEQKRNFSRIPVAVLEEVGEERMNAERVIMGIRHIAGPREWGAYQQAHFILELHEDEGQGFNDIADHLGLSRIETARRWRAIRALKGMEDDDDYAAGAKPEFYRLFHELVASPDVREFFSWDHDEASFQDEDKARQFFDLVAPQDPDVDPKLRTHSDVRKLRKIVGNEAAETALLDPDESFASVLRRVEPTNGDGGSAQDLMAAVSAFRQVLDDLGIDSLRALSEQDREELEGLTELIATRVEDYDALSL